MPNVTWTRDTAAHLLRRAGFGATQEELDQYEQMGLDQAVDTLIDYQSVSNANLDNILSQANFDFERFRDVQLWWITRMLYTARPLEEKMVFFWHDHFATSADKVQAIYMKAQNDLFRQMALPNFRDMLVAVSKDPAMIFWLDNNTNRVGRPNENYARELLELFSMGEGNGYTETDIQEIARCFTGWTVRNEQFMFLSGAHDNGAKSFLGTGVGVGGGITDGERVCDVVAARPETARHMARKLFEFFVYPSPSEAIVDRYAGIYTSSGFQIRDVMRAIFTSDEFYSDRARFALVKSPTEYVVGALKALDATVGFRRIGQDIGSMGQQLLVPPDVAGWDGGITWINTTTLLNRANFANDLTTNRNDSDRAHRIDVDALLGAGNYPNANKVVARFLDLLGPLVLTKKQRKPLKNYLVLDANGAKQPFALDDEMKDVKIRGLIHLIMSLPEYQLN